MMSKKSLKCPMLVKASLGWCSPDDGEIIINKLHASLSATYWLSTQPNMLGLKCQQLLDGFLNFEPPQY